MSPNKRFIFLTFHLFCLLLTDYGLKSFKAGQEGVRVYSPENGIGVELPRGDELDECDY